MKRELIWIRGVRAELSEKVTFKVETTQASKKEHSRHRTQFVRKF